MAAPEITTNRDEFNTYDIQRPLWSILRPHAYIERRDNRLWEMLITGSQPIVGDERTFARDRVLCNELIVAHLKFEDNGGVKDVDIAKTETGGNMLLMSSDSCLGEGLVATHEAADGYRRNQTLPLVTDDVYLRAETYPLPSQGWARALTRENRRNFMVVLSVVSTVLFKGCHRGYYGSGVPLEIQLQLLRALRWFELIIGAILADDTLAKDIEKVAALSLLMAENQHVENTTALVSPVVEMPISWTAYISAATTAPRLFAVLINSIIFARGFTIPEVWAASLDPRVPTVHHLVDGNRLWGDSLQLADGTMDSPPGHKPRMWGVDMGVWRYRAAALAVLRRVLDEIHRSPHVPTDQASMDTRPAHSLTYLCFIVDGRSAQTASLFVSLLSVVLEILPTLKRSARKVQDVRRATSSRQPQTPDIEAEQQRATHNLAVALEAELLGQSHVEPEITVKETRGWWSSLFLNKSNQDEGPLRNVCMRSVRALRERNVTAICALHILGSLVSIPTPLLYEDEKESLERRNIFTEVIGSRARGKITEAIVQMSVSVLREEIMFVQHGNEFLLDWPIVGWVAALTRACLAAGSILDETSEAPAFALLALAATEVALDQSAFPNVRSPMPTSISLLLIAASRCLSSELMNWAELVPDFLERLHCERSEHLFPSIFGPALAQNNLGSNLLKFGRRRNEIIPRTIGEAVVLAVLRVTSSAVKSRGHSADMLRPLKTLFLSCCQQVRHMDARLAHRFASQLAFSLRRQTDESSRPNAVHELCLDLLLSGFSAAVSSPSELWTRGDDNRGTIANCELLLAVLRQSERILPALQKCKLPSATFVKDVVEPFHSVCSLFGPEECQEVAEEKRSFLNTLAGTPLEDVATRILQDPEAVSADDAAAFALGCPPVRFFDALARGPPTIEYKSTEEVFVLVSRLQLWTPRNVSDPCLFGTCSNPEHTEKENENEKEKEPATMVAVREALDPIGGWHEYNENLAENSWVLQGDRTAS